MACKAFDGAAHVGMAAEEGETMTCAREANGLSKHEKTTVTTEELEKSKLLSEGKVEYPVDKSALHIPSGIGSARSPIRNAIKVALASTADPLRVSKSVTLPLASLVTWEVSIHNTIAKGGKHSEVTVEVDITAPDKIGISIKV